MAAYYNEIDAFAAAQLRALIAAGYIAPGEVDERSIELVRADDLRGFDQCHFFAGFGVWSYALRGAGWPDDARVWTGSCPCQPLSIAGRKGGSGDARHLWPAWFRLIEQRRPGVLFGEQVASGLGRSWIDAVSADLEGIGYAIAPADLCAAGVGAPHIRQRLYWVADTDDARLEGRVRQGQPHPTWQEWPSACRELMRSNSRSWPPGPLEVNAFPLRDDGAAYRMGAMRGYGNAIVPQVAETFIRAYLEAREAA